MKKPNRRSKMSSIAVSSPSSTIVECEEQEQQHFDRRVNDLERENEALKSEVEELKQKLSDVSPASSDGLQNSKEADDSEKFRALEEQVMELQKKLSGRPQLSAQKQNSSHKQKIGDAGISLHDEIRRLKAQKVQLLCKMKLESVHFRLSKTSLEKQILQLRKEERRNTYEMRKLIALNEKQKLVLQRKTEEASLATKRLKELLEAHKSSGSKSSTGIGTGIQGIKLELKIAERVEEIRSEYERQMEEMADEVKKFEEEAEMLKQENFRCLLEGKEADCKVRDSELKDLKEEVVRLSKLVNQAGMLRTQLDTKKIDVNLVKSSVCAATTTSIDFLATSESEHSGANNAGSGKSVSQLCCSCSKKSLCKTSKCECRAAMGSCGAGCGCAVSKCTNRAVHSAKVDNSPQASQGSVHFSGSSETEKGVVTFEPAGTENDDAQIRKPLHEIGNTLVNSSPKKHGQKKRGQKAAATLLDVVNQSFSGPENADTAVVADKPKKLTRAKRSAALNKNV